MTPDRALSMMRGDDFYQCRRGQMYFINKGRECLPFLKSALKSPENEDTAALILSVISEIDPEELRQVLLRELSGHRAKAYLRAATKYVEASRFRSESASSEQLWKKLAEMARCSTDPELQSAISRALRNWQESR
jgi:hypothetical protein